MQPLTVIGICWLVMLVVWTATAFATKPEAGPRPWWHSWLFRALLIAAIIFLANSALVGRVSFHARTPLPLAWLGDLACIFGVAFAVWARLHLGSNWSGVPSQKVGHQLVTSGPYRYVRHPIYTGILLAIIGSSLVNPAWLLMLVIMGVVLIRRIPVEERIMLDLFPDAYPAYQVRTKRLIPFVW